MLINEVAEWLLANYIGEFKEINRKDKSIKTNGCLAWRMIQLFDVVYCTNKYDQNIMSEPLKEK